MSVQALAWVLDHSRSKLATRLVLIAVANHADKAGRNSYASVATLAEQARVSERQARYALRELEELGELHCSGSFGPRPDRQTRVYELPLMDGGQNLHPATVHGGQNDAAAGGRILPSGGHKLPPIRKDDPTPDPKGMSGKPDAPALNGKEFKQQATAIIEFLNAKTGRHYRPAAANLDLIVARLKDGVTVTQLRQVVAKKCREWKGDAKMDQYLRPATLFNRMKFEQYVGELGASDGAMS